MSYLVTGGTLLFCCIQDIKNKSISNLSLITGGLIIAIMAFLFPGDISLISRVVGLATGLCMVLVSKIVKGQIGSGDGFMIMLIGLGIGAGELVFLLCIAFLLAGFFSAVLLIRGKEKNYSYPFVPFLFTAFIFIVFINIFM